MFIDRVVLDVAAFPMLIFNPIILLLLAMVVGLLVVGIIASVKKRKKTGQEIEQKFDNKE